CLAATGVFFCIDLAFFASNMLKLFQGGWFPLVIGGVVFTLMMTWQQGRRLVSQAQQADSLDLAGFLTAMFVEPSLLVLGVALFLTAEPGIVSNELLLTLHLTKGCHEQNLFVAVGSP